MDAEERPFVEVVTGAPPGRAVLAGSPVTIGRSPSAGLVVDHPSVSRWHAEVYPRPGGSWAVRDLSSSNGTVLNALPVSDHGLRDGDEIRVGEVVLRFRAPSAPAGPDTAAAADEDALLSVSSLGHLRPPAVSAKHVAAILAFGAGLQELPEQNDRLRRLLELVVAGEFGGWSACAVRVARAGPAAPSHALEVAPLCAPVVAPGAPAVPRPSRTVLRAVLDTGEPVVASGALRPGRFQAEMTGAGAAAAAGPSVVACPLAPVSGGVADVLYATFPPAQASVEWLMLVTMAVEQVRHAGAAWAARSAAEARAAADREMELARRVQAGALPRRDPADPVDWAVTFEPSRTVGGDYVDVIRRPGGAVLLLVADVAGKGMQAALVAAGLHAVFQTHARIGAAPLVDVVAAADAYLRTVLAGTTFATLAAAEVDPASGAVTSVNCGHPPMLIVDRDGGVRPLDGGDNLPLGLCIGPVVAATTSLVRGQRVVGYSDGLSEMADERGTMLGTARLRRTIADSARACGACDAIELAADVGVQLDAFRGPATPGDDRTLLIATF